MIAAPTDVRDGTATAERRSLGEQTRAMYPDEAGRVELDDGHVAYEVYEDFLEFFFSRCFTEPHSTKQREDCVGWGLETDAETLIATQEAPRLQDEQGVLELVSRIACPVLVVHGSADEVRPCASGARFAELAGGELVVLEGSGHLPHTRHPVRVNLLIREFVESLGRGER